MQTLTREIIKQLQIPLQMKNEIHSLMQAFHEEAKKRNLQYWAVGGTLLGLVRHKSIIPWDDDLDICVLDKDEQLVKTVIENVVKLDHRSLKWFAFKWENTSGWKIRCKKPNVAFDLDIFICEKAVEEGRTIFRTKKTGNDIKFKKLFPYDVVNESDMFDESGKIPEFPFGKGFIYAPRDPIPYLDFKYNDWRTVVHVFNHCTYNKPNLEKRYAYELEVFDMNDGISG